MRIFYIIKTIGNHYKTGSTENLDRRIKDFFLLAPQAVVIDKWPCPKGVKQEHRAQRSMRNYPNCCKWLGGENFEVYDEQEFVSELRIFFGEAEATPLPTYAEKFFGITLPRYK